MSIKQKILSRVAAMFVLATAIIIFIVSLNFRDYGLTAAQDKAHIIAELVKTGLTAHMINGTMDQRDTFLDGIARTKDIESLWVVRGENVVKQYGPPRPMEYPRDEIDKNVLKTGKMEEVLIENSDSAFLRVTIPYRATADEQAKCLQCHDTKLGETLGAITMEFDIMSIRDEGVKTIVNILLTVLVAIILIVILTNRIINPYLELFEQLRNSLDKASQGDFTQKIESDLKDEAGRMVQCYDSFLDKLESAFGQIDKKLRVFVASANERRTDPLKEATTIIDELASVYQFKKAIEQDVDKEAIYARLAHLIQNQYGVENFTFTEVDSASNQIRIAYSHGDLYFCDKDIFANGDLCRARRTGQMVSSDDFPEICPYFDDKDHRHICIPVNVGGHTGLVINLVMKSEEDQQRLKSKVPFIQTYANEAAPVLESKRLMQILKESSLKDAMTGLYNRRFLDEYVEKLAPQVLRQKTILGVLMVDMDYFKMVNDTYGHDIGDLVLKELAKILKGNLRDADLVVRYGGEEFIILLSNLTDEEHAMDVAEKLRFKVAEKTMNIGGGKTLQKTVSIGVALFPSDSESIWQTIKFADVALYEAKKTGRNRVVRFTQRLWEEGGY